MEREVADVVFDPVTDEARVFAKHLGRGEIFHRAFTASWCASAAAWSFSRRRGHSVHNDDEGAPMDRSTMQHASAITATVLAVVASLLQAMRALEKAGAEEEVGPEKIKKPSLRQPLADTFKPWKNTDIADAAHFHRVGVLWLVILAGAILSMVAEILDALG
jgi:hypothetical protein